MTEPTGKLAALPDEQAKLYGIICRMHTAWMEHEKLNESEPAASMFDHIELMASKLDTIRDSVPSLMAAWHAALSADDTLIAELVGALEKRLNNTLRNLEVDAEVNGRSLFQPYIEQCQEAVSLLAALQSAKNRRQS